jgi:hypothetical protein
MRRRVDHSLGSATGTARAVTFSRSSTDPRVPSQDPQRQQRAGAVSQTSRTPPSQSRNLTRALNIPLGMVTNSVLPLAPGDVTSKRPPNKQALRRATHLLHPGRSSRGTGVHSVSS